MITFRDIEHHQMDRSWCLIVWAMLCGTVCFTAVMSLIIVSATNNQPPNLLGLILMAVISLFGCIVFCALKFVLDNPETFNFGRCTCWSRYCGCCRRGLVYTDISDEDEF
jgi:hypothetical protein